VKEFYQEELRDDLPLMEASQERDRVPRKKIRAALGRIKLPNANQSDMNATTRMVYNTFSGFVHGAYIHIMDQYDGHQYRAAPSRHPRTDECADALTNYVYRGCLAAAVVAIRCRDVEIQQRLRIASEAFAAATGCVPGEQELREARARMKKRPE
jgi:hypothetical protein